MNRFFVTMLVVLTMSGCGAIGYTSIPTGSSTMEVRPFFFYQRGVNLQVTNLCSHEAKLYPAHPSNDPRHPTKGMVVDLPPGMPVWVPMQPEFLEYSKGLAVTVFFFEKGINMGTVNRSFRIDRDSTQRVQWIIGGERGGGGQNVFVDRCPRSLDRSR